MKTDSHFVAWAYMVDLESGLSVKQVRNLIEHLPTEREVVPFSNDVVNSTGESYLEANSIAYGFYDNEYYDYLSEIQSTLAAVCNNWDNERPDFIYSTPSGFKILMLCDEETLR